MSTTPSPTVNAPILSLDAAAYPVTLYYCKAGLKSGLTIRVLHGVNRWACSGVAIHGCTAWMRHDKAKGKAKASGARCVLQIISGTVELADPEPLK
jgi:hypothetical protein